MGDLLYARRGAGGHIAYRGGIASCENLCIRRSVCDTSDGSRERTRTH